MKNVLKLLCLISMTAHFGSCEQKTVIGYTAKCSIEYIDDNCDGINDSANVTVLITLMENSTVNYTSTVVYWDESLALSVAGLPVQYTQNVDLSGDSQHKFSFQCEYLGSDGRKVGIGTLPVLVENGEVYADYVVSGNSGITIK